MLANYSVGYVPLLLLTEYKLLRHPFSLPRKTWLMKSHSSHLRHALYKKQGQREILSSWLIKCVVGGVICHSPVVNPRWGRVKLLVDAFLWSALAPSTLNPQVWNAGLADASLVALWKPTDWQKLKAWCLEFEIYDWLGPTLYPIAWFLDPWGSHWWLPRMTIVEFLIKIIDEHKTWITWFFQCYQGFRLFYFHAPKMGCFM